jgi:hypothetical protein
LPLSSSEPQPAVENHQSQTSRLDLCLIRCFFSMGFASFLFLEPFLAALAFKGRFDQIIIKKENL